MTQPVNGVLYVEYFTPTGNPGEYTFDNGVFNVQSDTTGQGAYFVDTSFVIFVPILDPNTATPILGAVNRYKLTSVTPSDTSLFSGTMIFDEEGEELGIPGSSVFCMVAKTSPNLKLATPPIDSIYTDLVAGGTVAAMLNDLINILDKTGGGTSVQSPIPYELVITSNGQTEFLLPSTPVNPERTTLVFNGLICHYGATNDYTIVGNVLTWVGTVVTLEIGDKLILR